MYAARVLKGCRSKKLTWSACLLDDCLIRFKNTTQFNTLATHKITIAVVIVGWIGWMEEMMYKTWNEFSSGAWLPQSNKKNNRMVIIIKANSVFNTFKACGLSFFAFLVCFFSSFSWCFVSFSGENYDNLFLTTPR